MDENNEEEKPKIQIYTMKTQLGHERTVGEKLGDRIRRSGAPVYSILAPSKLRGYLFVEAEHPEVVRDQLKGLTYARGLVQVAGKAGKYKRSSKSNVTGTSSGGSLKTWVKQDWRQVGNPSKKCGEK